MPASLRVPVVDGREELAFRPVAEPSPLGAGLVVFDLRKAFVSPTGERLEVLRGVSLSAGPGEVVAITGDSGAGKSTLLHLIGGLEASDHGSISINDISIGQPESAITRRHRNREIGFIFQFHHLLQDLTAAENAAMPLLISRVRRRDALSCANRALDKAGLGARASHPIGHLSGGEQQRVAVCRALIRQPSLILADEPTANLDATIGSQISQSLVAYARARRAVVLMATHNEDLAQICDRVFCLQNGTLREL